MPSPSKVGDIVAAITYDSMSPIVGVLKSLADGQFIVVELTSNREDTRDVRCGAIIKQMNIDEVDDRWLQVAKEIQRELGVVIPITASTSTKSDEQAVVN